MRVRVLIVLVFVILTGCYAIGFNKGVYHMDSMPYQYDKGTEEITIITSSGKKIFLKLYQRQCGSYGFLGIVIPIIPVWDDRDCSNFSVNIAHESPIITTPKTRIIKFSREEKGDKIYISMPPKDGESSNGTIEIFEKYSKKLDNVYIQHNDKTYQSSRFDAENRTYTFPLHTKSLSDGAILVIEKKDQATGKLETFQIPFRYQHTFHFEMWGK